MFDNPGGGPLVYTAASSETAVATVSITGSLLTITPAAPGTTDITITARDDASDLGVTQTFQVIATSFIPAGTSIPDQQLISSSAPQTLDLGNYIGDPQGNPITFTASSNNLTAATVDVQGNLLAITPVVPGTATITVTARNRPSDAGERLDFQVEVINLPPTPTTTGDGIPNQHLVYSAPNKLLDLSDYFSDTEGDTLRYDSVSSNPMVATAFKGDPDNFLFIIPIAPGTTDISVTARDSLGATATQVFQVEITNSAPTSCCPVTSSTMTVATGPEPLDLNVFFSDLDASSIPDHALSYKAVSDNTAVATVRINQNILTITPVKRGTAHVTVTASDGFEEASLLILTIVDPSTPFSADGIPDQGLALSGRRSARTLNLNNYFSDPDGDNLEYTWLLEPRGTQRVTNVELSGSMLSISTRGGERGSDAITITASKRAGSSTRTSLPSSFNVVVDPVEPRQTSINIGGSSSRLSVHSPQTFNLDDYFESPSALSYTAASVDPSTVNVRIDGSMLTVTPVRPSTGDTRIIINAANQLGSLAIYVFDVRVPNMAPRTKGGGRPFNFMTTGRANFSASNHFQDGDGDTLIYTARSLDTNIATISLDSENGDGTIIALRPGDTTIEVTATDPLGAKVTRRFPVRGTGNSPEATPPIKTFLLRTRGISQTVNLNDHFTDVDDGQPIYTFFSDRNSGSTSQTGSFYKARIKGSNLTVSLTADGARSDFQVVATDRIFPSLKATKVFHVENPNDPPTRNNVTFKPEVTLSLGPQMHNLDNYFSDPNGDSTTYELEESFVSSHVTIRIERIGVRDNLIITPLARGGPVSFDITAIDRRGARSTHEFEVEVGNSTPVKMDGIPSLVMNRKDGPQKLVNIDSKFFDHDGDAPTYTATPSSAGGGSTTGNVATVDVDGNVLTITPLARGMVDFDIFASDGHRTSDGGLLLSRPHILSVNVKAAPTIDGTPALTVHEDSPYSFTPTGADADGDPLTYSILNKPLWAEFDQTTGALTGTPLHEHIGITTGIVIGVSEPSGAEAFLAPFDITVIDVNNAPVGRPVITGLLARGGLLTATTDTIRDEDGLDTFSYQWNTNEGGTDTAISGADSNTYTPIGTDVGKSITVTVSYTDGEETLESVTSESVAIGGAIISGIAREDETLTVDASGIDDENGLDNREFAYVWYARGSGEPPSVQAGDENSYILTQSEVGKHIYVVVNLLSDDGRPHAVFSDEIGPVENVNDLPTGQVIINGVPIEGVRLTATVDSIRDEDGLGAFSYQWYTNDGDTDTPISGANSNTYTPTETDVGRSITVTASYTDGQGTPESLISESVGPIRAETQVSISGPANAAAEGATAIFSVTLSGRPSEAVVVDYTTLVDTGDTAVAGSDFTETSGTLTFDAGASGTGLTQTISVPVSTDELVEGAETFSMRLSANTDNPLPTGFSMGTATATATIVATGSATVSIAGPNGSVAEGGDATFTVTLSGSPGADVVVDYAVASGTATAGDDFGDPSGSGTLTFAAGATGEDLTDTFTVPVLTDSFVEGSETFTATLSESSTSSLPTGFSLGTATATATIGAAGTATVSIAGPNGSVAEGGDATFTVTLSGSPGADVVVDYAVASGTATAGGDFGDPSGSGTLTFAAGATGEDLTQTISVPVSTDELVEGAETFSVRLSANTDNPLPTGFSMGTATATATIAASGTATVSISGPANAAAEGATAIFSVTLSGRPSEAVVVDYTTLVDTGDTAVAGSDFTETSGTLTFDAGASGTGLTQTISVPVSTDELVEGAETFSMRLSANTDNPLPTGFSMGTATATATIVATGSATVSIAGPNGSVAEGGDATFTVTLSGSPGADVVVDYAVASGTATAGDDFGDPSGSGTLTFAAGATGEDLTDTFTVPVLTDSFVEGSETFTATLSESSTSSLPTGFSLGTATATATIGAAGTATVSIAGPNGSVAEGGDATFTVTLSGSPGADVVVDYAVASGTATAGGDFGDPSGSGTLTFAAGATGEDLTQTISVPVSTDELVEGAETFSVRLSANTDNPLPTGFSMGTATATATIAASGTATVSISGPANAAAEGATAIFSVTLSGRPSEAVVVDYTTLVDTGDTAVAGSDFTETSGTLTFDAGASGTGLTQTISVPVSTDELVEGAETFSMRLSANTDNPLPTGFSMGTATATATIVATGSATVSIAGPNGSVAEGGDATFTVTLSGSPGADVVVDYAVASGTATAGDDFGDPSGSGTLTFAAGATGEDLTDTFTVPVLTDSFVEGSETFTATLSESSTSSLPTGFSLGTATATATIGAAGTATVSIAGPNGSVAEGGDATFTVTLSGSPGADVVVDYAVASGTATAGGDFGDPSGSGTLTFAAGATGEDLTQTISVPVSTDELVEGAETFSVRLSANTDNPLPTGFSMGTATATATIAASGTATVSISGPANAAAEGATAIFSVTLSGRPSEAVVVDYTTLVDTGDTAVAGSDFTETSGTLTFDAGASGTGLTQTISVPVSTDELVEGAETFSMRLSANTDNPLPTGFSMGTATATATIAASGTATVSISGPANAAAEGATAIFSVTLSGRPSEAVVVDYTTLVDTGDTAVAGSDFTETSGTLTFDAGASGTGLTQTISVPVSTDELVEGAETFSMRLSANTDNPLPTGFSMGTATATATIVATGSATVSIAGPNGSVAEGGDATFTVTLSGSPGADVVVDYAVASGTATAGDDFGDPSGSGTLTFAAGATGEDLTDTFTVPVLTDSFVEGSETFTATLSESSTSSLPTGFSLGTATATATIGAAGTATVSIAGPNGSVAEGGDATFTVTLSGSPGADVVVDYAVASGTATAGGDFGDPSGSGTLTFAAGATGEDLTQTISVPVSTDELVEGAETFSVRLSANTDNPLPTGFSMGTATATATIAASGTATVSISGPANAAAEGATAIFSVTLSGRPSEAVVVDYTTLVDTGDTAVAGSDFTETSGTLTFDAGASGTGLTQTISVPVSTDELVEGAETFSMRLSANTDNPLPTGFSMGTATATATIVATGSATVSIAGPNGSVAEGGDATFTVTLSGSPGADVVVDYAVASGTATAGDDFGDPSGSGTLTFAAGATGEDLTDTFTVPVLTDSFVEGSETFTATLSESSTSSLPTGFSLGTATATATIGAAGTATVSIAGPNGSVAEGGDATFTVTLSGSPGADVVVDYAVASGTATAGGDFGDPSGSGTLTFAAGATGEDLTQTISVPVSTDELVEGAETFSVRLSANTDNPLPTGFSMGTATATATIAASGTATVSISGPANAAAEGATAIFSVTLSGRPSEAVVVDYTTLVDTGDTAVAGSDFTETSGTLTFDAGASGTGLTQTISVPVSTDELVEGAETFSMRLSANTDNPLPTGFSMGTATATATIVATGSATVSIAGPNGSVAEGGDATFTVTLSGSPGADVVVDYAVASGTATAGDDFGDPSGSGTLTFAAGATGEDLTDTFTVPVLTDSFVEGSETFTATLSESSTSSLPTGFSLGTATATATIGAAGTATVSIAGPNGSVAEGGDATFTVTLSGSPGADVVVDYAVASGTATAGGDFGDPSGSGTLTFAAGATGEDLTQTISVPVSTDELVEGAETFSVRLSANTDNPLPTGFSMGTATATATIAASGTATVSISGPANAAAEGATAIFSVTLSGRPSEAVVVDYTTLVDTGDTAVAGSDFTETSGTLTFDAGASGTGLTQTISVPVSTDELVEGAETFSMRLSANTDNPLPTGFSMGTATATATIVATGSATVSIAGPNGSVAEGGDATFTVTLSGSPGADVVVDYAVASGTATAGDDFGDPSGSGTLTFAAGATGEDLTDTFTVPVLTDSFVEGSETFTATLSESSTSSLPTGFSLGTATATATIGAAGTATVSIAGPNGSVAEGGDATFTVTLSGSPGADVVVDYAVASGTATAGGDFGDPSGSGTLTFAAGATGEDLTQTISVPVSTDELVEGAETFSVRLSANTDNPLPTGFSMGTATATATIAASGTATVSISGPANAAAEGATAIFSVTLSGRPSEAVVVDYTTLVDTGDTAVAGSDFTETSGTLTFDAGASGTGLTQTISVPVSTDELVEGAETFSMRLSANTDNPLPTGFSMGTATATATIVATGSATVSIAGPNGSVAEGGDATFTVTLSGSPGADVVVDYAVASGTATAGDDFGDPSGSGTLTFAAGATGEDLTDTFTVPVLTDSFVEGSETFTATLSESSTSSLPTGFSLGTATATATIGAAGTATVSIAGPNGSVAEGGDATFTVTLSGSPGADVVVDYAVASGTATAGGDFGDPSGSGTLTFAAGATGEDLTQTISVPVSTDELVEGAETFSVRLSANTDNPLPTGFSMGTATATATIAASGTATVSISGPANAAAEGATAIFSVTLSGRPSEAVVVDYTTLVDTGDTAVAGSDFTETSGTLTFDAGASGTGLTQTISVPVSTDELVEGAETFSMRLSANTDNPLPTGFSMGTATATATIVATGSATVSIAGPNGSVAEGGDATFTVTLSGSPGADMVMNYATVAGSATATDDFDEMSGTLAFAAGAAGEDLTQTISVPVLTDELVEGTETFSVVLSANTDNPLPTGFSMGATTATATITANGTATVAEDHDRVGRKTLVTHLAGVQSGLVVSMIQNHLKALGSGNRVSGLPLPQAGRQGSRQADGQTGGFSANGRKAGFDTGDLTTGYFGIDPDRLGYGASVGYRDAREMFSKLEFHTSLNSLMASNDNGRKIGFGVSQTADGGNPVSSGPRTGLSAPGAGTVTVWGAAGETRLAHDYNAGRSDSLYDGTVWIYNTGLDYRASEVLTLGAAVGYSDSDLTTVYNDGTYDETMLLITPYLLYESPSGLDISLFGGYGGGEVDLTDRFGQESGQAGAPFTASTDTTLLFGAARVLGTMTFLENDALEVSPNVSLLGSRKTLEGYTDSANRTIDGTTATMLRLIPGLEIGYRFDFTGGTVTLFASGGLVLDFLDVVGDDDMAYSLGGGIRLETDAGLSVSLEGQRELGRDAVEQQRLVGGTLSYGFALGAAGQAGTLTPRLGLDHASGDGLSQAYGLTYASKDGVHRLSLDYDRLDETGARAGLGYQCSTEIMPGMNLEATVSSPNVEDREVEGVLGVKLRF